jgi:hypothetical protein
VAKRSSAGSWAVVGDAVRTGASELGSTSLAIDASGNPVVAWQEGAEIHVARFDGAAWKPLGGAVGGASLPARSPSIAMGPGDVPCVAFLQRDQASSTNLVDMSPRALAFDANGAPFVGWSRGGVARASCWNAGTSAWEGLGGGTVSTVASALYMSPRALAFDANGAPFVGWSRGGVVEVAYWGASQWNVTVVPNGGLSSGFSAPELVVDPTQGVVAGFHESTAIMAASHGPGGWQLLKAIVNPTALVFPVGSTFAAGPGTGLWGVWGYGTSPTYLRAERFNQ